jgi:hypothetical protein
MRRAIGVMGVVGVVIGCAPAPGPVGTTAANGTAIATATGTATATATGTATATATTIPTAIPVVAAGGVRGLRVDPQGLIQAGCLPGTEGVLDCSKPKSGADPGCFGGARLVDLYGGLDGKAGIAECNVRGQGSTAPEGLARLGCKLAVYRRLLVGEGGKLLLVSTPAEMKKRFAPIGSAEKAFSYALALGTAGPVFEAPKGMTMFVNDFAPSDARPVGQGFEVRLFDTKRCGCGPHETEEVVYLVSKGGDVSEARRRKVWNDPKLDGVCVD